MAANYAGVDNAPWEVLTPADSSTSGKLFSQLSTFGTRLDPAIDRTGCSCALSCDKSARVLLGCAGDRRDEGVEV